MTLQKLIDEKADAYAEQFRFNPEPPVGWKAYKAGTFSDGFNAADAIGFKEWTDINADYIGSNPREGRKYKLLGEDKTYTTEDLYIYYLTNVKPK